MHRIRILLVQSSSVSRRKCQASLGSNAGVLFGRACTVAPYSARKYTYGAPQWKLGVSGTYEYIVFPVIQWTRLLFSFAYIHEALGSGSVASSSVSKSPMLVFICPKLLYLCC